MNMNFHLIISVLIRSFHFAQNDSSNFHFCFFFVAEDGKLIKNESKLGQRLGKSFPI